MKSDRLIIQTISVVICLFLIVYVSFHSVNLDSQPYQTEVALTYTISDSVEASGVIIREEQLISGQASGGVVSYQQSDGTVVREGSVIAEVYSSSSDISIRRQIRALEEQITALQKVSDARSAEYHSRQDRHRPPLVLRGSSSQIRFGEIHRWGYRVPQLQYVQYHPDPVHGGGSPHR